jgi:hypothetical protein
MPIINPAKCASKLHQRAEHWEQGQLRSFAVVSIYESGAVMCDFDIEDANNPSEVNALGAGVAELYQHLRTRRAQLGN